MTTLEIIGIAFALAMDATAVAIAVSVALGRLHIGPVFRLSFHFGLFQALMPIAGWYFGRAFHSIIAGIDHWVAFALLAFIGAKMIRDYFDGANARAEKCDPTRGASLVALSVATSIDALAVGIGLAFLDVNIWIPAAIIGTITAALTFVGMLLGVRLGNSAGKKMVLAGGIVLLIIGGKIVFDHTF